MMQAIITDFTNNFPTVADELQLLVDRAVAKAFSNLLDKENSSNLENLLKAIEVSKGEIDTLFPAKEAHTFLNISRASLYNHSKNNPHFPKPKRIGRRIFYSKNALLGFLNQVKNYKREPP